MLPHRQHTSPPGDSAGTLERDSEGAINSDDSLLPHPYHDVSFAPSNSLRSTRSAERNGGAGAGSVVTVVVEANYPPIASSAGFLSGMQRSRLPDLRSVREMMGG